MPPRLPKEFNHFRDTLADCRRLAVDAQLWSQAGARPRISIRRRDWMIELAFLRGFLAWEGFMEESCLLYMLGESPMRGRDLVRYVMPPNRKMAMAMASGSRKYATWNEPTEMTKRAERFFRNGRPFSGALSAVHHTLHDAKAVRNAIAHDSDSVRKPFHAVVRNTLGAVPPRVTVGSYLNTLDPRAPAPTSFLEFYLQKLEDVSELVARP